MGGLLKADEVRKLETPKVGETVLIVDGKDKMTCTVVGVYTDYVLVEEVNYGYRETVMKVDLYTHKVKMRRIDKENKQ